MRSRKKKRQLAFRKVQWLLIPVALVVCLVAVGFLLMSYLDSKADNSLKNNSILQSDASISDTQKILPSPEATISTVAPTSATTVVPTTEPTPMPIETVAAMPSHEPTAAPVPTGPVWHNGFVDPRTVEFEIVSNPDDITVLINKYYAVSEDYSPELVDADSSKSQKLRPEADDAWDLMRQACETDTGKILYLTAGYSTFAQRKKLFDDAVANKGIERACSKYAYPGRSEHNLGLALDIATTDSPSISGDFAGTTAGIWLAAHAHEYGFILRYPDGKSDITGYGYEAWHYRYLGVTLATTLHESGQTLEEYYGKEQVMP
jgi:D-alanyl-D-alanine carboxypeptidase